MGVVNSEGETPLDIAEEEAMEELLQNEINRQGTGARRREAHSLTVHYSIKLSLSHGLSFTFSFTRIPHSLGLDAVPFCDDQHCETCII